MSQTPRKPLSALTRTALLAALLCVLAPLSIPIGPVPLSLATLVVYLSVFLIGWKLSLVSVLVYLLLGMVGLPVFSSFQAGFQVLAGPTGGYLIGYLPLALVSGLVVCKTDAWYLRLLGLLAGTALCYAFGTFWFCQVTDMALVPALGACVFPFIPGDLVKIAIALLLGPVLHKRLAQSGLVPACTGK